MKLNNSTFDHFLSADYLRPLLRVDGGEGSEGNEGGGGSGGKGGEGGEGGAGGADSWFAGLELSDDNKSYIERVGFKSVDAALSHGRNAEKKLGYQPDRILKLPEVAFDQDPEAWKEVVARFGVPEGPEGYEFKDADKIFGGDADRMKIVQDGFAKAGVPLPFANAAMGVYSELAAQVQEQQKLAAEAATSQAAAALKAEWGNAFDDKVAAAEDMVLELDEGADGKSTGFRDFLIERGLQNHPHIIKILSELGDARAETSTLPGRHDGGGRGRLTPEQGRAELKDFDAKWEVELNDKTHRLHRSKVQERLALIQRFAE